MLHSSPDLPGPSHAHKASSHDLLQQPVMEQCSFACADGEDALADVTNSSAIVPVAEALPPLAEEEGEDAAGGGNASGESDKEELAALRQRVRQLECAQALMERELDAVSAAASDSATQLRHARTSLLAHWPSPWSMGPVLAARQCSRGNCSARHPLLQELHSKKSEEQCKPYCLYSTGMHAHMAAGPSSIARRMSGQSCASRWCLHAGRRRASWRQ